MTHMFIVFLRHFKALAILGCPRVWRIAEHLLLFGHLLHHHFIPSLALHSSLEERQSLVGNEASENETHWDEFGVEKYVFWIVLDCFGMF